MQLGAGEWPLMAKIKLSANLMRLKCLNTSNVASGGKRLSSRTPLANTEPEQVIAHRSLSAVAIYSVIRHEGEEELSRPATSLWWSDVAA